MYAANILYDINLLILYNVLDDFNNTILYKYIYKFCNDNNYSNILFIISNYLNSHYNLIFSKKHKIYKVDNILRFN